MTNKRDKKGKTRWYRRKWQTRYSKMWKLQFMLSGGVVCPARTVCGKTDHYWCGVQAANCLSPSAWCKKHIVAAYERMTA